MAYNLYDLEKGHMFTSRDVIFYEHVFLFTSTVFDLTSPPLFTDSTITSAPLTDLTPSTTVSPSTSLSPPNPPSSLGSTHLAPSPPQPILADTVLPPRRSNRVHRKPTWLNDFVSHHSNPSLIHSCNMAYLSFVASLSILQEPRSFSEVVKHHEWREVMDNEIRALE
ncbi:UNVERIFIED_CONTAM: hypothetical protein Sradi_2988800 [Sesamum radiatum]|uniref:Uncharacterized protein n=1 Tax=Sesamum radiatum TaxID=300843 RepID=A0AAW2S0C1_SESRA